MSRIQNIHLHRAWTTTKNTTLNGMPFKNIYKQTIKKPSIQKYRIDPKAMTLKNMHIYWACIFTHCALWKQEGDRDKQTQTITGLWIETNIKYSYYCMIYDYYMPLFYQWYWLLYIASSKSYAVSVNLSVWVLFDSEKFEIENCQKNKNIFIVC